MNCACFANLVFYSSWSSKIEVTAVSYSCHSLSHLLSPLLSLLFLSVLSSSQSITLPPHPQTHSPTSSHLLTQRLILARLLLNKLDESMYGCSFKIQERALAPLEIISCFPSCPPKTLHITVPLFLKQPFVYVSFFLSCLRASSLRKVHYGFHETKK